MGKRPKCKGYVLRDSRAEFRYYAGPVKLGDEVCPLWVAPATDALMLCNQYRAQLVQKRLLTNRRRKTHVCQLWVQDRKAVPVVDAPLAQRLLQPDLDGQYKRDIQLFLETFRTPFVTEASRQAV